MPHSPTAPPLQQHMPLQHARTSTPTTHPPGLARSATPVSTSWTTHTKPAGQHTGAHELGGAAAQPSYHPPTQPLVAAATAAAQVASDPGPQHAATQPISQALSQTPPPPATIAAPTAAGRSTPLSPSASSLPHLPQPPAPAASGAAAASRG
eukprot:scaffold141771_cov21-Tisochrysis_lutea.AAC.1